MWGGFDINNFKLRLKRQFKITFYTKHLHKIEKELTSSFNIKIPGCKIQDVRTSISIKSKIEETSPDDDESDKHLEARDRRYSCLKTGEII